MFTSSSHTNKKNNEAMEALSDVSRLLSRLARSRKAPSKLNEVINLTREVARLSRSLHQKDSGHGEGQDDGYGDLSHQARISEMGKARAVVR